MFVELVSEGRKYDEAEQIPSISDLMDEQLASCFYSFDFDELFDIELFAFEYVNKNTSFVSITPQNTGKSTTAAFAAALKTKSQNLSIQTIIFCPTYQKAHKLYDLYSQIQQYSKITVSLIVCDTQEIQNSNIIIATPGSFRKYRNYLDLSKVSFIFFDDFDEILKSDQLYNSLILLFNNKSFAKNINCGYFCSEETQRVKDFYSKYSSDCKIISVVQ